jgi:hypothetical protein
MDGLDFTDGGGFGAPPIYFDFNSVQEIAVTSSAGNLFEHTTPGQQISFVTKQGANRHTPTVGLYLANDSLQTNPTAYTQPNGNPVQSNRIHSVFETVLDVGGPLVSDRAWYWAGYSQNEIKLALPGVGGMEARDATTLRNFSVKLNGNAADGRLGWKAFATRGNKTKEGRGGSTSRPPATTQDQDGPAPILTADVSYFFSPNFELSGQLGHVDGGFELQPQGQAGQLRWDSNFVWQDTWGSWVVDRPTSNAAIRGNWFASTGSVQHELRFGYKYKQAESRSVSHFAGSDQTIAAENFGEAWLLREFNIGTDAEYHTAWVGDTLLWNNWTFNAGLSLQRQSGTQLASTAQGNGVCPTCLPDLVYPGLDPNFDWTDVNPRLGATYLFDTARRQVVRLGYARYSDRLGIPDIIASNPTSAAEIDYAWNDLNGDMLVQPGEFDSNCMTGPIFVLNVDPCNPTSLTAINYIDTGLEAPTTDEWLLGFDLEVMKDFSLGFNITSRRKEDTLWSPLVDLTTVPMGFQQGDDTSSIRTLDSSDFSLGATGSGSIACGGGGDCHIPGQGNSFSLQSYVLNDSVITSGRTNRSRPGILTNRPGYAQDFRSVEITGTKRLSNRWMMRAFLSFQEWVNDFDCNALGPAGECTDGPGVQNPAGNRSGGSVGAARQRLIVGLSDWQYNVNFLVQLPKNVGLSANLSGREGYPIPYSFRVSNSPSSDGLSQTQDMAISDRSVYRYDDLFLLDVGVSYQLRLGEKGTIDFRADIFNALNNDDIFRAQPNLSSSRAGEISEVISPRVFRLSARATF